MPSPPIDAGDVDDVLDIVSPSGLTGAVQVAV